MDIWSQLLVLAPEIWLSIMAMIVLMCELVFREKEVLATVSCISLACTAVLSLWAGGGTVFDSSFISDNFSTFFKMIFYISAFLTVFISVRYIREEEMNFGEYYSLILFSVAGMMFLASANDLILLFLGLELMALSTYVLAGFKRHDARSNESALKYFLLGTFASALLLYGISLVYMVTGTTVLTDIASRIAKLSLTDSPQLLIGILFIGAAFFFKISAVPFHMWAPDVYEGAPTPITAFMSVGPKAAGFAVLTRVFISGFGPVMIDWQMILIVVSILTMGVGNILALKQTNIKRMLAYSSIAHAGYMLLGVIPATSESVSSLMLYILIYTFMNLGAFALIILLSDYGSKGEELSDYEGLSKTHPVHAALILIFMFSLTGIPPTAGFIGKFYLFLSLIGAGFVWLAVIGVMFSAISAYFYLRVVMLMYMRDPKERPFLRPSAPESIAVFCTTVMVIVIGVLPSYFIDLARMSMSF